jgi:hypothetical protein
VALHAQEGNTTQLLENFAGNMFNVLYVGDYLAPCDLCKGKNIGNEHDLNPEQFMNRNLQTSD